MSLSPTSSGGGQSSDTEIFLVSCRASAAASVISATNGVYASVATSVLTRNLAPWSELVLSGKSLQARIIGLLSIASSGPATIAMQVLSAADAGALAPQGAEFGAVATSSASAVCLDSGWVDLPSGLTVAQLIGLDLRYKTAGAQAASLSGCGLWLKAA